jgi:hypothetical protein
MAERGPIDRCIRTLTAAGPPLTARITADFTPSAQRRAPPLTAGVVLIHRPGAHPPDLPSAGCEQPCEPAAVPVAGQDQPYLGGPAVGDLQPAHVPDTPLGGRSREEPAAREADFQLKGVRADSKLPGLLGMSLSEYLRERLSDPAVLHAIATLAFRQSEPPERPSRRSRHAVPGDQPRSEPA